MASGLNVSIEELLSVVGENSPIVLDLGCGGRKQAGAVGIDLIAAPGVDIVGDVIEVLRGLPDSSVDGVVSRHFIEHIEHLDALVEQIERVTKPGGRIELTVPHFSNPYFYSDYTHRRPFGLYSFCYFADYDRSCLKRTVPKYRRFGGLTLVSVDLGFKASRPFYVRHAFELVAGAIFNSCRMMRELYERAFCYLWPCYELTFVLSKKNVTQ